MVFRWDLNEQVNQQNTGQVRVSSTRKVTEKVRDAKLEVTAGLSFRKTSNISVGRNMRENERERKDDGQICALSYDTLCKVYTRRVEVDFHYQERSYRHRLFSMTTKRFSRIRKH